MNDRHLGRAWVALALALALHVADEAANDFLAIYNPTATAIRARFPFLPLPTFTFETWLTGLIVGIVLLLALSPLAFRGVRWIRWAARPLAVLMFLNGVGHIAGSLYLGRFMAGIYSSPVLLAASAYLAWAAFRRGSAAAAPQAGAPPSRL